MSARNQRHGRGRRAEAKALRRYARAFARCGGIVKTESLHRSPPVNFGALWFDPRYRQTRRFDGREWRTDSIYVHVRADGTVVVTETATAPDCTYNARLVNLEPR